MYTKRILVLGGWTPLGCHISALLYKWPAISRSFMFNAGSEMLTNTWSVREYFSFRNATFETMS